VDAKIGKSHRARKELFQLGLRQGYLTSEQIEASIPEGSMTPAERWLLYYSLLAAQIEIRDGHAAEAAAEEEPEVAEPASEQEKGLGP
jgi:hypothetical protein